MQLPMIKETPHNEGGVSTSTSSRVAQSGCQAIAERAACVGNGCASDSQIEHQLDQVNRQFSYPMLCRQVFS